MNQTIAGSEMPFSSSPIEGSSLAALHSGPRLLAGQPCTTSQSETHKVLRYGHECLVESLAADAAGVVNLTRQRQAQYHQADSPEGRRGLRERVGRALPSRGCSPSLARVWPFATDIRLSIEDFLVRR